MAEAKEAISEDEFQIWALYRKMRGSFNQGMRLELEFAKFTQRYLSLNLVKGSAIPSLEEIMTHAKQLPEDDEEQPEAPKVVPFAQAMAMLGFGG